MRKALSKGSCVLVLGLAACGGGASDTSDTSASVTDGQGQASSQTQSSVPENPATTSTTSTTAAAQESKPAQAASMPNTTAAAGAGATPSGASGSGAAGPSAAANGAAAAAGSSANGMTAAAGAAGAADSANPDAADAPDPSPGCMGGTLKAGESMQMLSSGGQSRVYVQHIPDSYDGMKPMPVVLDLHGGSYDGPRWVDASGFKPLGDSEGFITLFPSGTDNSWLAESADSADGKFLRELIAAIGEQGCIDRKRIYATGCSMGGAMSFWMGCFASDLIAAIAPMCGTPFFELMDCKPQRPMATMLTIGETDNLNCWDGMPSGIGNPCAMQVLDYFKDLDMCPGPMKDTHDGVCKTYDGCAEGTEITVCKSNTGHGVYQATNIEVTGESWKFLKRYHL